MTFTELFLSEDFKSHDTYNKITLILCNIFALNKKFKIRLTVLRDPLKHTYLC